MENGAPTLEQRANGRSKAMLAAYEAPPTDPAMAEALNARAFADQARKIDRYGGREAILRAEDLGYTPPPQAEFTQAPGKRRD